MKPLETKQKVQLLRREGKTYTEIRSLLDIKITKSTLSDWCKDIPLPMGYQRKIKEYNLYANWIYRFWKNGT